MNWLSIAADLLHLVITVPVLFVGMLIGVFGYRYLLKKDPTLLASLVAAAHADLQKLATAAAAKAATAIPPAVVTAAPATVSATTPTTT